LLKFVNTILKMSLSEHYIKVRNYSQTLAAPLLVEDFVAQPVEFVSPPKWNLAHTTWFFEEFILKVFKKDYKEFNKVYSFLFNSYYNHVGERVIRADRGSMTRPGVEEIYQYRKYVDEQMILFLDTMIETDVEDLIILGINHEQQHQELFLTDLKFIFSLNPINLVYDSMALVESGEAGIDAFIDIKEGIYEIGFSGEGFSFDNERNRHKVYLQNYSISKNLLSNQEYIEFISDKGYENHELWHSEGWQWLHNENRKAPLYWQKRSGRWYQYTLNGLREVLASKPITHVNYYEAFAFSQWKGLRLPTEFEWEAAAHLFEWGDRWEWTESAYLPYPGFKKAAGAVGEYNGKFMVNQKVLRGASVATPKEHSRKTYRNFFHPNLGWQFTGIRLAK
jgi:ergothioneine biosynthesis protein EgtB